MVLMRSLVLRGSIVLLALCGVMADEANARVFFGFGVGVPLFVPPFYAPPPVYYPPYYGPPMVYAPPGNTFSYIPPPMRPQNLAPPREYYGPSRDYAPSPGYAPQDSYPPVERYAPPSGGYTPHGGYTPSMGMAAPVGSAQLGTAQSCQAGAYVCPLIEERAPGGSCTCPGHNGKRVRGQAN